MFSVLVFQMGKLHWFPYLRQYFFYEPSVLLFTAGGRISWKNGVGNFKGALTAEISFLSLTLSILLWGGGGGGGHLSILLRNFVWELRTTKHLFNTSYKILVSPPLPHTNTVILQESNSRTITGPGYLWYSSSIYNFSVLRCNLNSV